MKKVLLFAILFNCLGCLSYDRSSSDDDIASDNAVSIDNSVQTGIADSPDDESPCDSIKWKPQSEKDGSLVILSKPGDIIPWSSICVKTPPTDEAPAMVEYGEYEGVSEFSTGPSQVWRFSLPGGEYDGRYSIEYDGKVCEGRVIDPGSRNDE